MGVIVQVGAVLPAVPSGVGVMTRGIWVQPVAMSQINPLAKSQIRVRRIGPLMVERQFAVRSSDRLLFAADCTIIFALFDTPHRIARFQCEAATIEGAMSCMRVTIMLDYA